LYILYHQQGVILPY